MSSAHAWPPRQPLALHLARDHAAVKVVLVVASAALLGLVSQWEIPLWPVPISAQSLFVLLIGAGLGARLGGASMVLYLAMGAAGLPMFAGGASGAAHLVGPTSGYLVGFAVAAALVGWMAQHGWDRTVRHAVVTFALGTAVIMALGMAGLMTTLDMGVVEAFTAGVVPFWQGFLIKVGIASLVLPALWSATRRMRTDPSSP